MKINFTPEHKSRLTVLAIMFLFAGTLFKGLVGSSLNVFMLIHNTTIETLRTILRNLNSEIEKMSVGDKWAMNAYQQRKISDLKDQSEFIDLLIGYKLYETQIAENKAKASELRKQLKELQESTMTPQERISAMMAEINNLEGNMSDPAPNAEPIVAGHTELPESPTPGIIDPPAISPA